MTFWDKAEWEQHLRDEGARYTDDDLNPRRARSGDALPAAHIVKRLTWAINAELLDAETVRKEPMTLVKQAWRDFGMNPYEASELPMADMTVARTPVTLARVDQAHGSLFAALNVEPFALAEVDGGEPGDTAHHGALALSQELRDREFPNTLSTALLATAVAGTGVLKDGVVGRHLHPETLSIEDLYLSPHAPRDLEQCTMVAHRFYEPLWWVRNQALSGLFDKYEVRRLGAGTTWKRDDGGEVERETLGIPDGEGWAATRESGQVEMLEAYIRIRPNPGAESEMWRCTCARTGSAEVRLLRAERWNDGFPFTLLRIIRTTNTVYGIGFPNRLKDTQYASDMLNSAAMEADFMATAPLWEVDEMSPAGKLLKVRVQQRGGAVRPRPGEIFWRRGTQEAVRAIHVNPAPPAIDQRLNRLESYANVATIPVVPMQTYRSATEHRFAQANVSAKENMMLQSLRADLSRFLTRCARLYRKYVAEPWSPETFLIRHGSTAYRVDDEAEWNALRWVPRGMTSQADQMLRMTATQEAMLIVDDYWQKLPMYSQLGPPAVVALYESRRMRLEALGVQEWVKLLGENPRRDPNVVNTSQDAILTAQMLLGLQQGQGQMGMGTPTGEPVRASDGAPTVMPGGNPLAPGAPGEGLN